MNSEGWIPKEQARGEETRFGIPVEFLGVEKNQVSPPIIIMIVQYLLEQTENVEVNSALEEFYAGFKANYDWYIRMTKNTGFSCSFSYKQRKSQSLEAS